MRGSTIDWAHSSTGPKDASEAFEATLVQAKHDGVTRPEVGEDVWAITLWDGDAARLTRELASVHRARSRRRSIGFRSSGLSRHCSISALTRWLAPFLELRILPDARPVRRRTGPTDRMLSVTLSHGQAQRIAPEGACRLNGARPDDVWRAVEELELDEIQHGIAAASSPSIMRMLADNRIRLNVCPTSNVMLGRSRMSLQGIRSASSTTPA